MHTWGCIRPHTRARACVCVCMCVCVHVCVFVRLHMRSLCRFVCLFVVVFVCVCIYLSLSLSSVCLCLCLCLCALCACRKPASTEVSTGSSNIWPNAFVQNPNQLAILLPSLFTIHSPKPATCYCTRLSNPTARNLPPPRALRRSLYLTVPFASDHTSRFR